MDNQAQRQKATEGKLKLIGWIALYLLLYLVMPESKPPTCSIMYFGHGSRYGGVQAFINPDTFRELVKSGYLNHTGFIWSFPNPEPER